MGYEKVRVILLAVPAAAFLAVLGLTPQWTFGQDRPSDPITRPVVSEETSQLEPISPVAEDGNRGQGFLRKPPGRGPFPAVVWIHGGLSTRPVEELKEYALSTPNPSRFLAAGYVVMVITYRSRDEDPQSNVSLKDCLAAIAYLRRLPYVDPKSIVISGCSGGGDLALEVAAATHVTAIAAEEPATVLFTGLLNKGVPKAGERYAPGDGAAILADPKRYYTANYQKMTREKIERIRSPILIQQGDQHALDRFNAEVLLPELRSARKNFEVITYPGEPHCFAFYGSGPRTPRPAAALKAFHDADAFFRRYLHTKPKSLDPKLVKQVPI